MGFITNFSKKGVTFIKDGKMRPAKDKTKRKRRMRMIKRSRQINAARRKGHAIR